MKYRREKVRETEDKQKPPELKQSSEQLNVTNRLRNKIVGSLRSDQVENLVVKSNKQNPIEIVNILVCKQEEEKSQGILLKIESYCKQTEIL